MSISQLASRALAHCQTIAGLSENPHNITRTFLSQAMRSCQAYLTRWMQRLGMQVQVDAAGNLRGFYSGVDPLAERILIGSHLDSVPDAGAYDGVLGVVLAISLIEALGGKRLKFGIEVVAFSEEEGVRFSLPFIGSRALVGDLDEKTLQTKDSSGVTIEQAIRDFGLLPERLRDTALMPALAYIEFHIEQGPVLESIGAPLGVVETIAGQSRATVTFLGRAAHAGTAPMPLRQDALCAAAEWISFVEKHALSTSGLVATVGRIEAKPGASNAVPGEVIVSLDVRHSLDSVRSTAFATLGEIGQHIAEQRKIHFESITLVDQPAVPMNGRLTKMLERAIQAAGAIPHRMTSGAGHDAMIVARKVPCAMMFLRSPGGISHHPDETVQEEDVALALRAGLHLLRDLSACPLST